MTNQLPSAGTQAQVSLVVYGSKGCSRQIPLGNAGGSNFQAGSIDEFMVSISWFNVSAGRAVPGNLYDLYVIDLRRLVDD
jgi:PLAT/LH2 domain